MKLFLVLIYAIFLSLCGFNQSSENEMQKYGEKVSYTSGRELKFPDFSIKFAGQREVTGAPVRMTFYDFEVSKGETKKKISWSSGTGDIGPTFFEIGGESFVLELSQSDLLKSIGEGNLVIWKKAGYDESLKKYKN
jgi:hypothetical protein